MIKPVSGRIQLIIFFILLILAAGSWFGRNKFSEAGASLSGNNIAEAKKTNPWRRQRSQRAVPVIVRPIATARSDENITTMGTAYARRHMMLRPKADGQLAAFLPHAGDRVTSGQLIFKLDTVQAELAVKLAEKRLEDAERLLQRQQQLKRQQVVSVAKVADNLLIVERAKLELRQAQKSLQDLIITAPFTGIVGLPSAEVGERVTTSTDLVSLDDRHKLLIEFKVPERYAMRIKRGDSVHVRTPSLEGQRFPARIEYIDSRIETTSRTVKVRSVIANEKDVLRPGMSFAVEMVLTGKTYLAVPELSLQWRKGESYIWVVRDGYANKVLVTIVQRQRARVLIDGGAKPGELVVVEGVQRLRHGRPVEYEPVML